MKALEWLGRQPSGFIRWLSCFQLDVFLLSGVVEGPVFYLVDSCERSCKVI